MRQYPLLFWIVLIAGSAAILLSRAFIVDYREARTVSVIAALILVSLLFWIKGRQQ
jgi:hypothetical protein